MPPALNNRNCECGTFPGSTAAAALAGTSDVSISSTVTTIVNVVPGQIIFEQEYDYGVGSGPYTHTIMLPVTLITPSCQLGITLYFPDSSNPNVIIVDSSNSAVLATQPAPGVEASNHFELVFNGTNWRLNLWS